MERNGDCLLGDNSQPKAAFDCGNSVLSSNLFVDKVGEVVLTHNSDGLSWKSVDVSPGDGSFCWRGQCFANSEAAVNFSDIYAVELIDWGTIHEHALASAGGCLLGHLSEMYRFAVHSIQKSKTHPSLLSPVVYIFGHKNLLTCQMWVNQINSSLAMETDRPKNLLVFVHPRSGKGTGRKTWEDVVPIFAQANVKTKVTVTEKAGHAFDVMASLTNRELSSYDGVVAVGGDGLFNEILNGLLLSRHKASYPARPANANQSVENTGSTDNSDGNNLDVSDCSEDHSPLLMNSGHNGSQVMTLRFKDDSCQTARTDPDFSLPHERFRFGIIPAGSTDATVICTTGARDPITSALHIVLGKRVSLDIAQVVRWRMTSASKDEPYVRYAATFAGYGFYGDVITESEKYRWMGPKRYDFAGTKVFLQHRSYEAEVAYLEVDSEKTASTEKGHWIRRIKARTRVCKELNGGACCARCSVCNSKPIPTSAGVSSLAPYSKESRWLKSKGRFQSVGAAVISCRNERAPDGLVADAHLSDGFLHLVLVKDCPRALYLWHLTEIARKGGNPLDFPFVEHHKTTTFTFTSYGKQSVWNVDGEILLAHQLSAQVFRGLVSMFATGPEV